MVHSSIRFHSSIKDAGSEAGEALAGELHTKLIFEHISQEFKNASAPDEEEGYAWSFGGQFEGVYVTVITSTYEDRMMTLVTSKPLLLRARAERAVVAVANRVAAILRSDGRIQQVVILTPEDESRELEDSREKG